MPNVFRSRETYQFRVIVIRKGKVQVVQLIERSWHFVHCMGRWGQHELGHSVVVSVHDGYGADIYHGPLMTVLLKFNVSMQSR